MGIWMCQLFSVDELEALDQNQYVILKNEIRWQLESNKDIMKILDKKVRPTYNKLSKRGVMPRGPRRGKK
jgi:hypothetical protein